MDAEKRSESQILLPSNQYAVTFQDACHCYSRKRNSPLVLRNFEMQVKKGTIYALIGSSGCGKTTVLSCIVGYISVDSGEVKVLGRTPDSSVQGSLIGYMPQNEALPLTMTIQEATYFFGHIHRMTNEEIKQRLAYLMKLLQIPPQDRVIHTLSGGQKKRVSLTIAMLHNPKLLVLDEPTVGMDPLLRQRIWQTLRKLALEDVTIILSTHYVEETKQADTIGFMRNGRLIFEDSPESVTFGEHNSVSKLDDMFLSLCIMDEENSSVGVKRCKETYDKLGEAEMSRNSSSANNICALMKKNFIWFWRNIMISLTFSHLPLFVMLILAFTFGGDPKKVNLGVVNHEWPADPLCQSPKGCSFFNLSCAYMGKLDHEMVTLVPYPDEDAAVMSVEKGDAFGVLIIPKDYSRNLFRRFISKNKNKVTSSVTLRMDMASLQTSLTIQHMMLKRFLHFARHMLQSCNLSTTPLASAPIASEPIYGSNKPNFLEFIAPGYLIQVTFAISFGFSAVKFQWEKFDGMMERTIVSGVRHWEFIVSHIVSLLIFSLYPTFVVLLMIYILLQVPVASSLLWIILLCILNSLCAICAGTLIGVILPGIDGVVMLVVAIAFSLQLLGGLVWPLEAVHRAWLRWMCYLAPVTLSSEAMRSMVSRGWGISSRAVLIGFASELAWICVLLGMLLIYFALRKKLAGISLLDMFRCSSS